MLIHFPLLQINYSDSAMRTGVADNFAEAQALLIDIFLLAEGDVFVGKFTSNIDRIAFALMCINRGGLVPYISLDISWCFDWGQYAGVSKCGTFVCCILPIRAGMSTCCDVNTAVQI